MMLCYCYNWIQSDLSVPREGQKGKSDSQLSTDFTGMCVGSIGVE